MPNITILPSTIAFEQAFAQCCGDYDSLDIYAAWVGDPRSVIPFEYLHLLRSVRAVVGQSFCRSHPGGIAWLMERASMRIAKDETLFHPKTYLFSGAGKTAALIGSSNFTYQGFTRNIEMNVLVEGSGDDPVLVELAAALGKWRANAYSFIPDRRWLTKYEERYKRRRKTMRRNGLEEEVDEDNAAVASSAWLASATWDIYYRMVVNKLRQQERNYRKLLERRLDFFDLVAERIPLPWETDYFDELENRKIIGGMYAYGWLGHVAASGDFKKLMANGSLAKHRRIVDAINTIASLNRPVDWRELRRQLNRLISIGPTMKVWSRLLAITRPDYYCTISAPSVRRNLSSLLGLPQNSFQRADGYIRLLQLIHASPWFNSPRPTDPEQRSIWEKRTAFIDIVLYERQG